MNAVPKSLLALFVIFSNPAIAKNFWHKAKNYEKTFQLSNDRPSVIDFVFSNHGKAIYKIDCHPQDYVDDIGFDYRGLIQCRLSTISSNHPNSDILMSDSDWNPNAPRSSFMVDLNGLCRKHKDYGSVRHFFVRGLRITFKIENIQISSLDALDALKNGKNIKRYRFDFGVKIENAPRHFSENAEGFSHYCYVNYKVDSSNNIVETLDTGKVPKRKN